jgi:hypothetical protein
MLRSFLGTRGKLFLVLTAFSMNGEKVETTLRGSSRIGPHAVA